MTIEELHDAIETYPHRIAIAMEAVAKAKGIIEKIEDQIADEEAQSDPMEDTSGSDAANAIEQEEIRLRLEHEIALLELSCERIKGEVELEYRRNPPARDKVTEATVSAHVKSNSTLIKVKETLLEKKFEYSNANISRRINYTSRRLESRRETRETMTSPKMERLQQKLEMARMSLLDAERNLEEAKASLVPYQLLVQLYTSGLIK